MGKFHDLVLKRIADLSTLQAEKRARADREQADIQQQVNTLAEIDVALTKEPELEVLYLKAISLDLKLQE
jgi:hypothetical protein